MRRALLKRLPALTKFYGIKPADLDLMTLREVSEYLAQMEQYEAEEAKANAKQRSRA